MAKEESAPLPKVSKSKNSSVEKSGPGRGILGNPKKTNATNPSSSKASSNSGQGQSSSSTASVSGATVSNNYSVKATPSKPRSRFSLRRLFYTNPLLSPPFTRAQNRRKLRKGCDRESGQSSGAATVSADTQSEASWVAGAGERDTYSTASSVQGAAGGSTHSTDPAAVIRECSLCLAETSGDQFPNLRNCHHLTCVVCLQQYVRIEIQEGRVNLKCPQCSEILHPNDIEMLVGEDSALIHLYESLMLRRVLAADPDTRWCPAPNCTFAVVATGCASCPKINCERYT